MTAQSFKTLVFTLCLLLCIFLVAAIWLATWPTNTNEKGTNLVGGAFELIDQDGNNVNESSFPNKFKLIYFGFTFCPDVCPIGLNAISEALDTLGTKAKKIKPLFITVDPLRDTVDVLKNYKESFHESFTFLTGSPEQIQATAKLYKVYFRKTSEEDDYLVDHSAITYIMSPSGGYLKHFGPNVSPSEISNFLSSVLK